MTNTSRQKELKEWYKEAINEGTSGSRLEQIFRGTTSSKIRKAVLANGNVPINLVRSYQAASHLESIASNTALELSVMFKSDKASESVAGLMAIMSDDFINDPDLTVRRLHQKLLKDRSGHLLKKVSEKVICSSNRTLLDKMKFIFLSELCEVKTYPKQILTSKKIVSKLKEEFKPLHAQDRFNVFKELFSAAQDLYRLKNSSRSTFVEAPIGVQIAHAVFYLAKKEIIDLDQAKPIFDLCRVNSHNVLARYSGSSTIGWSSIFHRPTNRAYTTKLDYSCSEVDDLYLEFLYTLGYIDQVMRTRYFGTSKFESLYSYAISSNRSIFYSAKWTPYVIKSLRRLLDESKFSSEEKYKHLLISIYNCQTSYCNQEAKNLVIDLFRRILRVSEFEEIITLAGGSSKLSSFFRGINVEKTNINSEIFIRAYNAKKLESNSPA